MMLERLGLGVEAGKLQGRGSPLDRTSEERWRKEGVQAGERTRRAADQSKKGSLKYKQY